MPSGFDNCSGLSADDPAGHAFTFGHQDAAAGLIGATYWRRRFNSYVPDGTFANPRASGTWAHAGVQGPTLRAAVGDELRVRVRNRSRLPASLHLHGIPLDSVTRVKVAKAASGSAPPSSASTTSVLDTILSFFTGGAGSSGSSAPTANTAANDPFSSGNRRSVCVGPGCAGLSARSLEVAPGETIEYSWRIPASAGPGPNSAQSSAGRLYSSLAYEGHNDPALAGLLVVVPAGGDASGPDALPLGVAAERLALFSVSMEHASPYLALNVLDFVWRARLKAATDAWPAVGGPASSASDRQLALRAGAPSASIVPVPASVTPAALLAALYNAAVHAAAADPSLLPAGGLSADAVDETHSLVLAVVGSSSALAPSANITMPTSLLGLNLGTTPATLRDGALFDAAALAGTINLLDASGFVARFGQRALESAIAPLALEQLKAEPNFNAGEFDESNTMHGLVSNAKRLLTRSPTRPSKSNH